jgi:hypothetical protein
MATRIPVSWLFVLALLAVFAFFGYHILQASSTDQVEKYPPYSPGDQQKLEERAAIMMAPSATESQHVEANDEDSHAPVRPKLPPVPNKMPDVPGQTEDDLRAPNQIQATPPTVEYDSPEATDPLNRNAFMSAEFGSNLRHPEQMIEARPGMTMGQVVSSGLGSEYTNPGGNRVAGYASEMAQNGGEFMNGISAFDGSESGVAYSML